MTEAYISMVEYVTLKMFPRDLIPIWRHYRWDIVADLCDIILTILPTHVQSVNGASIYIINEEGVRPYLIQDKLGDLDGKVISLLKKALDEIGLDRVLKAARQMGVYPNLIDLILGNPKLRPLWDAFAQKDDSS